MNPNEMPLEMLKKVTVFAGIDEDNLRKLCAQCVLKKYKSGDMVIQEGTPASEIYVILKGKCKVVLNAENNPLEIVELFPGHCIGEASIIGVQNHSASAIADGDVELLELSRKVLMGISQYDKDLFSLLILNIARELARRLYHTDRILLQFSQMEQKQKDTPQN
jgi:CRP-like cAMP-binding protein